MAKKAPWYRRYIPAGSIYKNGNFWWISIMIAGKLTKKSLGTSNKTIAGAVAKKIYQNLVSDASKKDLCIADIDEALELFCNHDIGSVTDKTIVTRKAHIKSWVQFAGIDFDDLTPAYINKWLDTLAAAGKSAKTRQNYRTTLSKFCSWLVNREILDLNPVQRSEIPKRPPLRIVYMQRAEFDAALDVAKKNKLWAVFFAAYAGLRQSEIIRLNWFDLDLNRLTMTIIGKGGKIAAVPISNKLADIIAQIPRTDNPKVFPKLTYKTARSYLDPIKEVCPTLQIVGQKWHVFRRTFGSLLVQSGVSIAQVSKLMRHSNITTTEKHYAHLVAEHGRDAVELL